MRIFHYLFIPLSLLLFINAQYIDVPLYVETTSSTEINELYLFEPNSKKDTLLTYNLSDVNYNNFINHIVIYDYKLLNYLRVPYENGNYLKTIYYYKYHDLKVAFNTDQGIKTVFYDDIWIYSVPFSPGRVFFPQYNIIYEAVRLNSRDFRPISRYIQILRDSSGRLYYYLPHELICSSGGTFVSSTEPCLMTTQNNLGYDLNQFRNYPPEVTMMEDITPEYKIPVSRDMNTIPIHSQATDKNLWDKFYNLKFRYFWQRKQTGDVKLSDWDKITDTKWGRFDFCINKTEVPKGENILKVEVTDGHYTTTKTMKVTLYCNDGYIWNKVKNNCIADKEKIDFRKK